MLLNLKRLRSENVTEKLINIVRNELYPFVDQDAINAVFLGKTLFLSRVYNFIPSIFLLNNFDKVNKELFSNKYYDEDECINDQKIFHFAGKYKPWKYWMPWITDIFLRYYNMSSYKDEPLNLKSPIPEILEDNNKLKDWRFPREKISKGKKVILYGAGDMGKSFYKQLKDTGYCEVVLWVDRNYEQMNKEKQIQNGVISEYSDMMRGGVLNHLKI